MNRERKIHLTLLIFLFGFFLGTGTSLVFSAEEPSFTYLDYFHSVYQTIKFRYVEQTNAKELFYGAIDGMIRSLDDPYSRFLGEEEYAEFNEVVTGQFVGIGIEITVKDDEVIVITPISDSPADKAGIMSGDRIVRIDDIELDDKNLTKVLETIKGKRDTTVKLTIEREGFTEPLEVTVTRKPIKISAVKHGVLHELPATGYIKITNFYDDTHLQVRDAVNDLQNKGMRSLILDLRNNPGGNMETCIHIADYFLEPGKIIVTTRGRDGSGVQEEYKSQESRLFSGELLVLVNNGSASASEILAGALKDNGRADIAGEKTFGKALVQQIMDIEKGKTGYALTVQKYFTPSGEMIHKKGIAPDHSIAQELIPPEDRKNLGRVLNDGLISSFAQSHPEYNESNVRSLVDFLESKQLPISKRVASYFYKNEVELEKPSPLYDLEFDIQLKKSLQYLKDTKSSM